MTEQRQAPAGRVLIVEDEMMISMLLEDLLQELGYETVGPATIPERALAMARSEQIDAAILDVNLNGQNTFPVAEILHERGIPFVFATGYGTDGVAERFRNRPILSKPFHRDDLDRAVSRARLAVE